MLFDTKQEADAVVNRGCGSGGVMADLKTELATDPLGRGYAAMTDRGY